MAPSTKCIHVLNEGGKANELNEFFCRFEKRDFSHEQKVALDCVPVWDSVNITIDQDAVERLFSCGDTQPSNHSGPLL